MRLTDRLIATCASIAIATCGLAPVPAFAAPQDELAAARRELETYGEQLAEVQTKLVKGADELNVTESEIVERQGEADKTKEELTAAQAILAEHMRENYRAGNASLISVLLEAETVEDLVSRVYYLDKIAERNSNEIAQVRELQTSLEQQVTELEAQRDEQQRMLDEASQQAETYTERIAEAQAYYNELDAKVQAQLAAEAAAAAAKAQADTTVRQTNDYGVITDGMQNAMDAITSSENTTSSDEEEQEAAPEAGQNPDETGDTESTDTEAAEGEAREEEAPEADNDTSEEETPAEDNDAESEPQDEAEATSDASNEETDAEDSPSQDETATEDSTPEDSQESPEQTETTEEETPAQEPEEPTEEEATPEPPAEEEKPTQAPGNDGARSAIISMAYQYLGVPYVWGGKSPSGFDCSGLTTFCYENCGVDVGGNRTTYQLISWIQERGNWKWSMDELQPGDMIFPSAGHTAIYLGNGRMIHAPHEGDVVREADVYAFYGGGWAG